VLILGDTEYFLSRRAVWRFLWFFSHCHPADIHDFVFGGKLYNFEVFSLAAEEREADVLTDVLVAAIRGLQELALGWSFEGVGELCHCWETDEELFV
jgi:hypothetical protein